MKVFIDITVLNYDGNIYDCATIASLCALNGAQTQVEEGQTARIDLNNIPISSTFQKIDKKIVYDPTLREELASNAYFVVSTDEDGIIRSLQKGGDGGLTRSEVLVSIDESISNTARIKENITG